MNATKQNRLKLLIYGIYFIVSVLLLSLKFINPGVSLNISYVIKAPVTSVIDFFARAPQAYNTYMHNVQRIKVLEQENAELHKQLYLLQSLNIENTILTAENTELRKIFSMLKNTDVYNFKKLITAKVFFANLGPHSPVLGITAGSSSGVSDDLPVVSYNALIGKTTDTTENYCKILLITNSNSRVPVYTKSNNINATVVGNNTAIPTLITYEKDQYLKEGDIILTSGLGGIFPRNIPVGTIHKNNNQWTVKLYNNLDNLLYVHIITKNIRKSS